jgi:thioesterase domain-containing protein/acyl carrier protein
MITLCFGAALYFPNTEQRQPGTPLWQYLEENAISHITLPPTALAVMPQQPLQKLTHLIVAGEPCPPALAKYWSTGRRFFNAYGPTETTVCATIAECAHADIDADAALPIGRPIANTQIYILDRYNQPTPIGVPGELYIGGAGLARGYLNRPELTAEKFIPDPFSHDPGARLYKTGDRVRYLPDGNIEFLGRIDHQVKIRGFRIELGEIEAVLAGHLDIRETVVVARTEKTGDKRLVAYLVADGQPNPTELRDFLKLSLPDYMLPSAFVYLDDLPLTPNGKVDRKALPEPEICSPRHDSVAPRDAIEQQLIQIWEHLLSVHPIGVEDNFFEIGGHSLLAIRLVAKINKRFDKSLPVSQIFAYPTIAGIASRLRKGLELPEASCLVKIRPQGSRSPLFFLPGVEGTVSYLYPLAQQLNPDIPFFAFQAKGLDRKSSPYTTMEEMAGHFVELLLEVQPQGPYFLAGHSFGGRIAFAMAQILLTRGQIIGQLTIVDAIAPGMVAENSAPLEVDGQLLLDFFTIAGLRLKLSREEFKKLSTEEQLACAVRLLEEAHLLPEGGGIEYLDGLLDVHKANLQIHNQYAPEAPGLLPITLLRASETMADQIPIQGVDEDLGWGRYAHQPVAVHYMPGDHITMMRPPHVGQLAQSLGNTQVTLTCEQHLNACSTVAI